MLLFPCFSVREGQQNHAPPSGLDGGYSLFVQFVPAGVPQCGGADAGEGVPGVLVVPVVLVLVAVLVKASI